MDLLLNLIYTTENHQQILEEILELLQNNNIPRSYYPVLEVDNLHIRIYNLYCEIIQLCQLRRDNINIHQYVNYSE